MLCPACRFARMADRNVCPTIFLSGFGRDAPVGRLPLGGPTSQELRRGEVCLAPAMLIGVCGEPWI